MNARFFVPETIQTSAVDCGPAALKSLMEGFGIAASYGRLREACQTGLDGTSIDTIEVVAREVGLDAQQVMLPVDYLALDDTVLPAVLVIRTPAGMAHFIVVWRRSGPFFQIMDPASGRRWVRVRDLLATVYVHRQIVGGADWRAWASSEKAIRVLRRRIVSVAGERFAEETIARTLRDEVWLPLARLDAATRLVESLVRNGAVRRGGEAERLLAALGPDDIPAPFWSVSAADGENVVLRGAVLIRIGRGAGNIEPAAAPANAELAAAVREPRVRPLARVLGLLSPATRAALPLAAFAAVVLGVSPVAEGLLFRSMYDLVVDVGLPQERLAMLGAFALFAAFLLALDYAVTNRAVKWGHELQARFATALFGTLSTLRNDYFGSRLISDLAERSHAIAELRSLPLLLARVLRASGTFAITFAALLFLMPQARGTLVLGALALLAIALAFQPLFAEIDLRARTHTGGLTRFYLDALAGLGTIHAHCAERAVRSEHESLMTDWVRALRRQIAAAVSQTTILAVAGFALTAVLIRHQLTSVEDPSGVLLIAYWALNLPLVAADLAQQLQVWASQRSVVLRLIEPLDAPREDAAPAAPRRVPGGVAIAFHRASFAAAGHAILTDVDLVIPAGLHVGIVGSSGAGKSTLVGALLGFMQPREGEVRIDGELLTLQCAGALRRETAWVDPAIQLFNAPMEENVRYASIAEDISRLPFALSEAGLYEVLQRIPDSQMPLGEGGGMLSGGEGQRVRLARAVMQTAPRLVILDEAFRGMDRTMRDELLRRCRRLWKEATFLFVTHDVEETAGCDRVVVMNGGQVAEYDTPAALIAREDSLYNCMRAANREIREELWGSDDWRRLELRDGHLTESGSSEFLGVPRFIGKTTFAEELRGTRGTPRNAPGLSWPIERLAEATEAIARARRWGASDSAGVETQAVTLRYAAIESELRALGAALVVLDAENVMAIVRTGARHAQALAPDGRRVAVPLRELRELLCAGVEARYAPDVERVLAMSGIAGRRRERSRAAMLRELVGDAPVGERFLGSPGFLGKSAFAEEPRSSEEPEEPPLRIVRPRLENAGAVVRDARLLKKALAFLALNAAEMLLYVLSWWIVGLMAFDTRSLETLFTLWLLAVLTIVPLRAGGVAAARSLVLQAGSIIKRRILLGALKLSPDEVNGKGVGTFLSHVLESGHVEALGTSGAFAGLTSVIAGIAAIYVMSRGAGGAAHVALYLVWIVIAAAITVRFGLGRAVWTEARFALTGHVVENLTGHKTRLAQKEPGARNEGEDLRLERYMETEVAFNRSALQLEFLRRLWPWAGLFALAPMVSAGSASTESLSIAAAGVLLGATALTQWTDASAGIAGALSAWRRVAPFWRVAGRKAPMGSAGIQVLLEAKDEGDGLPLVHASSLTYRHARRDVAALEQVDLTIRRGERILLRGPSGSGKSTLAALLSGVRPLQSGLLFYRGLDVATVGLENWRRRMLLVPQFHANHTFIGTVAYNLLLGRAWPPSASDRLEALEVCRALGLGPLIAKMPLALDQPVGETGWQLSHGERTRVFLARSILQKPALMILDETFAALDPKTLAICMRYVLDHEETVLVVAHP